MESQLPASINRIAWRTRFYQPHHSPPVLYSRSADADVQLPTKPCSDVTACFGLLFLVALFLTGIYGLLRPAPRRPAPAALQEA